MAGLYFIAVIPGEPVYTEVHAFKEMAAALFDTHRALRSPPHVTLYPPFRMQDAEVEPCRAMLATIAAECQTFNVDLRGFDAFRPRVIFVGVEENLLLSSLQTAVAAAVTNRFGLAPVTRPFHPHMTVAFKDLRKSMFYQAWDHFKSIPYDRTFAVGSIALLRHEKPGWRVEHRIPLRTEQ